MATTNPAVGIGNWFSELSSADVAMQAFVTVGGKRLLVVNKRLHPVEVDLTRVGKVGAIQVVNEQSGDQPARSIKPDGNVIRLGSFAVVVVEFE